MELTLDSIPSSSESDDESIGTPSPRETNIELLDQNFIIGFIIGYIICIYFN